MTLIRNKEYKNMIAQEADHWGDTAVKELKQTPPDYQIHYQHLLSYQIYRKEFIKKALSFIKPGDRVLELGCYNGWFSIELARKGAKVDAYDVAKKAVKIAKTYYTKQRAKEKFKGTIRYHVADLNFPKFPDKKYDVIIIRSVLHHIIEPQVLIKACKKVLKPKGIVIADDNMTVGRSHALLSGAFLFLLPTDIPYRDKPRRVLRKKKILTRTKSLIEAKGTSPFESISGEESLKALQKSFHTIYLRTFSAFIGVVASQVRSPEWIKRGVLKILNSIDKGLIKTNVVKGTAYFFVGRK